MFESDGELNAQYWILAVYELTSRLADTNVEKLWNIEKFYVEKEHNGFKLLTMNFQHFFISFIVLCVLSQHFSVILAESSFLSKFRLEVNEEQESPSFIGEIFNFSL